MRLIMGAAAAVCALGLLVGCSEDEAPKAIPASSTTKQAASAVDTAKDLAAAEAAILQLGDLPTGYTAKSKDPADEADNEKYNAKMATCMGVDPKLLGRSESSAESSFVGADEAEVTSEVGFAATVADAEANIGALRNKDFSRCFSATMRQVLLDQGVPPGAELGDITVDPLPFAKLGDEVVAHRTTITVRVENTEVKLVTDLVMVRVGRGAVSMTLQSNDTPFPKTDGEQLTQVVVGRMPKTA